MGIQNVSVTTTAIARGYSASRQSRVAAWIRRENARVGKGGTEAARKRDHCRIDALTPGPRERSRVLSTSSNRSPGRGKTREREYAQCVFTSASRVHLPLTDSKSDIELSSWYESDDEVDITIVITTIHY